VLSLRYVQTYRVVLSFKQETGRWIMYRIVIVILIVTNLQINSINIVFAFLIRIETAQEFSRSELNSIWQDLRPPDNSLCGFCFGVK
jgi:hypothetical protein